MHRELVSVVMSHRWLSLASTAGETLGAVVQVGRTAVDIRSNMQLCTAVA